jgi:hypothetical protein
MLAVAVSPHGLTAIRLNEAALSQELCTVGLLQPHILVEYQWQNIGLCHEDSSTTSALATSCRNLPKTSSRVEILEVREIISHRAGHDKDPFANRVTKWSNRYPIRTLGAGLITFQSFCVLLNILSADFLRSRKLESVWQGACFNILVKPDQRGNKDESADEKQSATNTCASRDSHAGADDHADSGSLAEL